MNDLYINSAEKAVTSTTGDLEIFLASGRAKQNHPALNRASVLTVDPVFLHPPNIGIFLTELLGFMFPAFQTLSRGDLRILLTTAALARNLDDARKDDSSVFGKHAQSIERLIEPGTKPLDQLIMNLHFPKFHDRFAVRKLVTGFEASKAHETATI